MSRSRPGSPAASTASRRRCSKCAFAPAFLSFLPAVWGDYQIIALGPEYDHAVVGTPDRAYLWVLARAPRIDPGLYRRLLDGAKAQGFDVAKVVETRQQPPGS